MASSTNAADRTRGLVRDLLRDRVHQPQDKPVHLLTGADTSVYLDPKSVFDSGPKMRLVGSAVIAHARAYGIRFNTVGGPTMGSDFISHAVVMQHHGPLFWFSVREHPKDHGLGKVIEGADLGPRSKVLLVDDVADSGSSLLAAAEKVRATGAWLQGIIPLVDRADKASELFLRRVDTAYLPLLTYRDLDIPSL